MNVDDYDYLFEDGNDILCVANGDGDFIFRRMFDIHLGVGSGYGTVTTVGGLRRRHGDVVVISAVPDEGYAFVNWDDGVTTPSRRIEINASDISVKANFKKKEVTPAPTPEPSPTPIIPEPDVPVKKAVSISLTRKNGNVTCTTTPSDATVTWSDSNGRSGSGNKWSHSGKNNSTQTVTFTAKKEGYSDWSESKKVTKTVKVVPIVGKTVQWDFGTVDDGYENASRNWNYYLQNQTSKTDSSKRFYSMGSLYVQNSWYSAMVTFWDRENTETTWS